jgi:hypothetical protein
MFADVSEEFAAPIFWIDEEESSYQRMRRRILGACNLNRQDCEKFKSHNSFCFSVSLATCKKWHGSSWVCLFPVAIFGISADGNDIFLFTAPWRMKGEKYRWCCCWKSKDTWCLCVLSSQCGVSVVHTLTSRIKLTLGSGVMICSMLGCSNDSGLVCSMV